MRFFHLLISLAFFAIASANRGGGGDDKNSAVFRGVRDDDGEAIRSAVEDDPSSLESIGPGGQTPLIHAVLTGKLEAVKTLLLELGADASATEKDGYNVLHAAGFQGRAKILRVLLEHFAEQKKTGGFSLDPATDKHRDGYYPMHRACWGMKSRHTETVKVFLEYGVPYDLPGGNGKTCEDMSKSFETIGVIQELQREERKKSEL